MCMYTDTTGRVEAASPHHAGSIHYTFDTMLVASMYMANHSARIRCNPALAEERSTVPQVAVEKSKGALSNAIELLRKYVDTYMLDKAAWEELGELYLQVCDNLPMQPVHILQGTAM